MLAGQVALSLFPALMIAAAASDVLTLRIPNLLPLLISALFFPVAIFAGMSLAMIGLHAATAAVFLVAGFLLFLRGLIGGGDAKLLAAAALWIGYPACFPLLVFTALAGGVLALGVAALHVVEVESKLRQSRLSGLLGAFKPDVPYGFALAAGAILALPQSWWMDGAGGAPWLTQI